MFTLSRRRMVLAGACLVLTVLPAVSGFTAGRVVRRTAATPSPRPPSPSLSPGVTFLAGGFPEASGAPSVAAPPPSGPLPPSMPPPVGWKLSDLPLFGPTPVPEPVVLPEGDEVPYLSRIPVTQPVAFITMDDGYLKNPEAPKLFAAAGVPVTLFLTTEAIHDNVPFFDELRKHGAVIEAHTISHPELRGRSASFQRRQICGSADRLGEWYGRRPVLFRPPYGHKDHTTLRVAKKCGLKAGFMWKETVHEGKVRYQEGNTVQRGDIMLMHFRPAFIKDFIAALKAIHRAGLVPALLEDYIPLSDAPTPGLSPGSPSPSGPRLPFPSSPG